MFNNVCPTLSISAKAAASIFLKRDLENELYCAAEKVCDV